MSSGSVNVVERGVSLPAGPGEVWRAVTTPERLSEWLGVRVELDVRPGGRGIARREDGAVRRIRVEAVEAPRRLAFRWWPYERDGSPPGTGTRVEFLLDETPDGGTRLTVVESAWPGLAPRAPAEVSV